MASGARRLLNDVRNVFEIFNTNGKSNEPIASISSRLEGRRWVFSSLLGIPAFDIEWQQPVFEEAIWM